MARPGLTQHRKFRRLERALGSHIVARGALETMWDVCYQNGDPFLGDSDDVEAAAHWDGAPGKLTKALLEAGGESGAGFIEEIPGRPGQYQVHDLYHHAPDYVRKRRSREAARRAKTDPVPEPAASDRSVTGQRQPSPDCRDGVDCTPAPAPAPAPLIKTSSSEPETGSDQKPALIRKRAPQQPSHEALKLAALFKAEILRNKPDYRITTQQERKWAMTADRMLRLDGRTEEQIATLIRWAQGDEFWMRNVLSMDTLREKFDQLELKREYALSKGNVARPAHPPQANLGEGEGNQAADGPRPF